ncbi:hypothetical protein [Roseomonas sp. WA12]
MKNFRFTDISILSPIEKKARAFKFHPRKNLFVGRNHTGKSTVIKHLFLTLGATPEGKLTKLSDDIISAVSFSVNGDAFTAVRQHSFRALFSGNGKLLGAADNGKTWASAFVDCTGFNLVLPNKKLETIPADARCFFLPFYINQDGSWQSKWDTFVGLQQYRNPVESVLEYFSGIKPPEYYDLNSSKLRAQNTLAELSKEKGFLEKARDRFSGSLSLTGPKADPQVFEQDIDRLTREYNDLNVKQEQLRDTVVREKEQLADVRLQIQLADEALSHYDRDTKFLREDSSPELRCPTCGAEHDRTFIDILGYTEEARRLRELVVRLNSDAVAAEDRFESTRTRLRVLEENYKKVGDVLAVRRGEISFGDVVASMGAEQAFRAFEGELIELQLQVDQEAGVLQSLLARLKDLGDSERTREITRDFKTAYTDALVKLNLSPVDTRRMRITSRPTLSGSGGPRSMLAYYAALWAVCRGRFGSFDIPLVIDAPQQQGQDDVNLPKILSFIAHDLPQNAQVIAGIEMETDHHFDQRFELTEQYGLLRSGEYESVQASLGPLTDAMYDYLRSRGRETS